MKKELLLILTCLILIACTQTKEVRVEQKFEPKEVDNMKIKSVFENNEMIPSEYTCDGANIMPAIKFEDVPENTKSIALIIDDPDAPSGDWVHMVVWNIPISGDINAGIFGINDFGKRGYGGPCPPSGIHRYFFKAYALDTELNLSTDSTKKDLQIAMQGHIIEKAELVGKYSRTKV